MIKSKLKENPSEFTEENIKEKREFPVKHTIILSVFILVQIFCIFIILFAEEKPKDIINEYNVTVEPQKDGTLDIEYQFVWTALDEKEDLTWMDIGLATPTYILDEDSLSDTIKSFEYLCDDMFVGLRLNLDRAYKGGETVEFSFKVNQEDMLVHNEKGYFYEFVPGWFNSIPVEKYTFRWKDSEEITDVVGGELINGYHTWQGSFDCGEYEMITVRYSEEAYKGKFTVSYYPFDASGAYDVLASNERIKIVLSCIGIFICLILEIGIADCYISYHRGRGFLVSCGYHIHTYGSQNPKYVKAYNKKYGSGGYSGTGYGRGYGRGGGGWAGAGACAWAGACAGGGRAGCSQKDTYENKVNSQH